MRKLLGVSLVAVFGASVVACGSAAAVAASPGSLRAGACFVEVKPPAPPPPAPEPPLPEPLKLPAPVKFATGSDVLSTRERRGR